MSLQDHKAIVRRVVDVWNERNLAAIDEYLAPDYVNRDSSNPEVRDLPSYKRWAAAALVAFPDFHVTVDDLIAEGDQVVKLWTFRATHQGEFLAHAPTGRQVMWTGITLYRLAGVKVVECVWRHDALGLLQQLGALPALGQPATTAAR